MNQGPDVLQSYINRQDVWWAARIRRVMEVNGMDNEESESDSQEVIETLLGAWEMSGYVEDGGRKSWWAFVLLEGV